MKQMKIQILQITRTKHKNLSDDEILGKPITPKEIHEHISKLRQRKQAAWILS